MRAECLPQRTKHNDLAIGPELGPLNPLTPTSDHDRISSLNINTISSRQVMKI